MRRFLAITVLVFLLLLFNGCLSSSRSEKTYISPDHWIGRELLDKDKGYPMLRIYETFRLQEPYFFRSQYRNPKKYENYNINIDMDELDRWEKNRLLSVYISEARIVLPTGETIDLMSNKIWLGYHERGERIKAQPQMVNGKNVIYIKHILLKRLPRVILNADIPSSVDSVIFEYTIEEERKNIGVIGLHCKQLFRKEERHLTWHILMI